MITPPADGATLRVGDHRLRDPRPLGSSPGTFVHDQPKNQGCFLDNVLVVTTSEPPPFLPRLELRSSVEQQVSVAVDPFQVTSQ